MKKKNQLASTYVPQSKYRNNKNQELSKIDATIISIGKKNTNENKIKKKVKEAIQEIHFVVFNKISQSIKLEDAIMSEIIQPTKATLPSEIEELWKKIKSGIYNYVKVHYLSHHIDSLLNTFEEKLNFLTFKYKNYLPNHVALVEGDDLKTIAQLELIETFKAWDPTKNKDLWPLAYTRVNGAMKDHIRYISKSDPTRFYDWVSDAANLYLAVSNDNSYEETIENNTELDRALDSLSEKEQKVVILYLNKDLTFKQISEKIDLSESQVSRIYKESVKKIKEILS